MKALAREGIGKTHGEFKELFHTAYHGVCLVFVSVFPWPRYWFYTVLTNRTAAKNGNRASGRAPGRAFRGRACQDVRQGRTRVCVARFGSGIFVLLLAAPTLASECGSVTLAKTLATRGYLVVLPSFKVQDSDVGRVLGFDGIRTCTSTCAIRNALNRYHSVRRSCIAYMMLWQSEFTYPQHPKVQPPRPPAPPAISSRSYLIVDTRSISSPWHETTDNLSPS